MEQATLSLSREKLLIFILAFIQFAHMVDFVVMMPLGPTLMANFGIGPVEFASLVSSYNLSAGLSGLVFSFSADKYDRKHLLVLTLIGFILGTWACGLSRNFTMLLAGRFITGACGGVLNSLVLTLASDLVPLERRGKAMSSIMSAFSFASVMGVPLGLTLSDKFGWTWAFHFIVIMSSIVGIFAFKILPSMRDHIHEAEKRNPWQTLMGSFKSPSYLQAHILLFNVSFSMFLVIPFIAPFAVKNLGIDSHHLKYMYICGGLVTIFTARLIGKLTDRFGPFPSFLVLALGSCVPVAIYGHASPMGLLTFLGLTTFFMAIVSGRMIPCMTMISSVASIKDRASFMSILNSVRAMGSALAGVISGLMITESPEGFLLGYERVSNLSVALIVLSIFSAWLLKIKLQKRELLNSQDSLPSLDPPL